MKKLIIVILIVAGIFIVYDYRNRSNFNISEVKTFSVAEGSLENIKKEVFAPGGLRGFFQNEKAVLSQAGVTEWTNIQRQKNNLSKLSINQNLNVAAKLKVEDMFKGQYFDHVSPNGKGPSDLADRAAYEYIRIGENLALGNYENDKTLVQAWMDSPGHRKNILNSKFTEIGVYVKKGIFEGESTWLAVQEFGKPLSSCPNVDLGLKQKISSIEGDINRIEPQIASLKLELENKNLETEEDYNLHNKKVSEYNSLVKVFNNRVDLLKSLVNQYNKQVRNYNLCAES